MDDWDDSILCHLHGKPLMVHGNQFLKEQALMVPGWLSLRCCGWLGALLGVLGSLLERLFPYSLLISWKDVACPRKESNSGCHRF